MAVSKTTKIINGEPWHNGVLSVPNQPHVFKVASLTITDEKGVQHVVKDATVISAHGFHEENGHWVFKDGSSVAETIKEYNLSHPNAPINAALVCNPGPAGKVEVEGVIHATGSKVQVGGYSDPEGVHAITRLTTPESGSYRIPGAGSAGTGAAEKGASKIAVRAVLTKGLGPVSAVAGFLIDADPTATDGVRVVNGRRQHYQYINGKPTWVDDGPYNPSYPGPTIGGSSQPPPGWLPGGGKDTTIGHSSIKVGNKIIQTTSEVDPHTGTIREKDGNGVVYSKYTPPTIKLGHAEVTTSRPKQVSAITSFNRSSPEKQEEANIYLKPNGQVEVKDASSGKTIETYKDRQTAAKDLLAKDEAYEKPKDRIKIDDGPSTQSIAIPPSRDVTDVPASVVDTFIGDPNAHGSCFPAGSLVSVPGGHMPIEDIKLGDMVMTWNFSSKSLEPTQVTDTLAHAGKDTIIVKSGHSKIITTPEHPFWDGKRWAAASKLKAGSKIMDQGGRLHEVESVHKGPQTDVYNFHVTSPAHNYFVDGFLVHNMKMGLN
jgi:hypothetical protein